MTGAVTPDTADVATTEGAVRHILAAEVNGTKAGYPSREPVSVAMPSFPTCNPIAELKEYDSAATTARSAQVDRGARLSR
jgi:hypothetical protein